MPGRRHGAQAPRAWPRESVSVLEQGLEPAPGSQRQPGRRCLHRGLDQLHQSLQRRRALADCHRRRWAPPRFSMLLRLFKMFCHGLTSSGLHDAMMHSIIEPSVVSYGSTVSALAADTQWVLQTHFSVSQRHAVVCASSRVHFSMFAKAFRYHPCETNRA